MTRPISSLSPAIQLDLPNAWYLRSVTVNPVIEDKDDGAPPEYSLLIRTLKLIFNRGVSKIRPVVWVEFQIGTSARTRRHQVPNLRLWLPSESVPDERAVMQEQLSRSLAVVATVTLDASGDDLEAAYGVGAKGWSGAAAGPNGAFLAIERPLYRRLGNQATQRCYFAVGVCREFSERSDRVAEMVLTPLPIHRASRIPVTKNWTLGKGETMAVWVPVIYPEGLTGLTYDDRRYLNISVIWPRRKRRETEILSFPRVSQGFRLVHSTPSYQVRPLLDNDPTPWETGHRGTYALDAAAIVEDRHGELATSRFSLTFEDVGEARIQLVGLNFVSVFAGVFAGVIASLAFEGTEPPGWLQWSAIPAAVILCLAYFSFLAQMSERQISVSNGRGVPN